MTASTDGPGVTIETSRLGIAVVTISNERHGNALLPEMTSALMAAWRDLDANENVRVIVVTATGERAFSAGNDLTGTPPEPEEDPDWNFAGLNELAAARTPVIAAINGYAVGGGLEIALACDIRIASRTATFSLPEPKLGLIAGIGGTQRLPRVIGLGRAMHMLLTAEAIDAPTALAWGLVTTLTEPTDVLQTALKLAEQISAMGPRALRATKRCTNAAHDLPLAEGRTLERHIAHILRYADESAEGRAAFKEKRAPSFPLATASDPELAEPAPTTPDQRNA